MYALAQSNKLRTFDDRRWHADPFGAGIRFQLLRAGCNAHREWLREREMQDPLMVRMASIAAREEVPGDGADDVMQRLARLAKTELIAEGLNPLSLMRRRENDLEEALHLLRGWDGLTTEDGAPVLYSAEEARKLLTLDTVIVAEGEWAGVPLGRALCEWVLERSYAHEAERQQYLGDAEGNAEASSVSERA